MKIKMIMYVLLIFVGYGSLMNTNFLDCELLHRNSLIKIIIKNESLGFGEKDKRPEIIEIGVNNKNAKIIDIF